MPDRTHAHAPWCARPPRGCFLGCVSPDLIVYADESQNAVTVRLWAPLDRDGSRPPVIDVEARCGNLGTVSTVTLPTGPTKQLAHNLAELLALANGGD